MALSQLITTIDNNNIGINGNGNGTVLVGLGTPTPLTGLHLGTGLTIPTIYLSDAASSTLPILAANSTDGIFSIVGKIPTITTANDGVTNNVATLFTLSSEATGTGTLATGTVLITSGIVTTSSVILVTRTSTTGDVTTMGTLSVIAGTGSFTVNSTVITDLGSFNYLIINA
jgi:hypothetical protein